MTGKLDFVLQFRDEQVAEEVRRKAELGWLDVEFVVYGTAYLKDGKRYYRISSNELDIYEFVEKSMCNDIFCANPISYSKRCSVPIGTKEDKELEIKKLLGKQLQEKYPVELFELLKETTIKIRDDQSYEWLQAMRNTLEGVFDEEKLRYFEIQLEYCYSCQRLLQEHYLEMKKWIEEEKKYMEDDFVEKDLFEKSFYGILYEDKGTDEYRHLEDSLAVYIYKKKMVLESQGILVGPIYAKKYWYHYGKTIKDLKEDYMKTCRVNMGPNYWSQLRKINTTRSFDEKSNIQLEKMSKEAQETYRRYLSRWRVVGV